MEPRPPIWMIIVLVVQAVLALALLILGTSLSRSMGGNIAVADILGLSVPLALVLGTGALSWWLWGQGQKAIAGVLACLPLLVSFVFFGLFGIV